MPKTQRIRDPVHGLIVFRERQPLDQLAWALLNTREFQRLRRIKQLGFCELVFPGATHTRFAHCIGVFETARTLVDIIKREQGQIDNGRAEVAVLAALLHDLGHGPFSHAFELAQRARGVRKRHEVWTSEIIRNPNGEIHPLLEVHKPGLSQEIADLLVAETPGDVYDAIVSSSFDADRLDYLRRDRLMTGSGAGAIDFDWLVENLRIATIDIDAIDDQPGAQRLSFCLDAKALQAAEGFLLARYHLYTQVYLHKTSRCVEQMLAAVLRVVGMLASEGRFAEVGLPRDHPLLQFLVSDGNDAEAYLALDDTVIWGAIERLSVSNNAYVRDVALRIRHRRLFKALDIDLSFGESAESMRRAIRRIERDFAEDVGRAVLKDTAKISIYGVVGADDAQAQKRLMIQTFGNLREITELSKPIESLIGGQERTFTRFYFADPAARDRAREGR